MKNIRTFRIEDELWVELKTSCEKNKTTPSQIIRKSIKEFINYKKKYEKENND